MMYIICELQIMFSSSLIEVASNLGPEKDRKYIGRKTCQRLSN
jgi:hypothetical protein